MSETRQGYQVSPLFSNIVCEVWANPVKQNIKDICIRNKCLLISGLIMSTNGESYIISKQNVHKLNVKNNVSFSISRHSDI